MQPCVTKPVLLESECSMRPGHKGFLPISSLPFSPSLGCTQQPEKHTQRSLTRGTIWISTALLHINPPYPILTIDWVIRTLDKVESFIAEHGYMKR